MKLFALMALLFSSSAFSAVYYCSGNLIANTAHSRLVAQVAGIRLDTTKETAELVEVRFNYLSAARRCHTRLEMQVRPCADGRQGCYELSAPNNCDTLSFTLNIDSDEVDEMLHETRNQGDLAYAGKLVCRR